jgi:polyisoprenoid-binding protein YceI
MKKIITFAILTSSVLMSGFKSSENATWIVDKAQAKLGFTITHMMVSDVEGWFKSFDAKITSTKDDFSDAVVELTADVSSINTDNDQRDKHLKSPDFFDVEKYPTITFKSKSFKKVDDKSYKITGDLTMHGVTKSIELEATCRMGSNPVNKKIIAGFKITGKIKRTDFRIGPNNADAMLSDEVVLVANAEFVKSSDMEKKK